MNKSYKFIHEMSPEEAYNKLIAIGEEEEAAKLLEEQEMTEGADRAFSYGIFDSINKRAWKYTEHAYGFIKNTDEKLLPIVYPGQLQHDEDLINSKVTISLDRINVADYPGNGEHQILFDFYTENIVKENASEKIHYNLVCRAYEGQSAAIVNHPIFVDLNVGTKGLSFKCLIVNIKNKDDEKFLQFLEGDVFKSGLKLLTGIQPALIQFSKTAENITKTVLSRNQNIPVQEFLLGLDFSNSPAGLRLCKGSYVVVQIPQNIKNNWDWSQWFFDITNGRIINTIDSNILFDFNYIIFSIK